MHSTRTTDARLVLPHFRQRHTLRSLLWLVANLSTKWMQHLHTVHSSEWSLVSAPMDIGPTLTVLTHPIAGGRALHHDARQAPDACTKR
jgi:hypothetical protein